MDLRTKLSEQYDQVKQVSTQLQNLAVKSLQYGVPRSFSEDGLRAILSAELDALRNHLNEYFRAQETLVRAYLTGQPQALVERVLTFFREHEDLLQEIRGLQEHADEEDLESLGTKVMETLCKVTEHEIGERIIIHEVASV